VKHLVITPTLAYLRFLAKKALKKHHPTIIGIAGSVGKSSTRNAIEAILKDHFRVKSVGNSETGIPLGILGMSPTDYTKIDWAKMLLKAPFNLDHLKHTEYLIAEMGIDEPDPPKNMEYLLTILKPDIAVDLNSSATHSEQFDKKVSLQYNPLLSGEGAPRSAGWERSIGRAEKLNAKERLNLVIQKIAEEDTKIITKSGCKVGIYNADDENLVDVISQRLNLYRGSTSDRGPTPTLLTFGTKNKNDISYGIYSVNLEGSYFQLFIEQNGKNEELKLKFKHFVVPEVYKEVFSAAILAALETGLTLEQIKKSLEKNFTLPKGRSSILKGINNTLLIDSTYNASKQSALAFLDLLDKLENETSKPTVFVFGDMRELGEESKIEHKEVAKRIIGTVDYLYLVGPQTMEYVLPIVQEQENKFKEIRWFDDSKRAGEHLKEHMPKDAIVLFKGSQNTIFLEEAIKMVLEDKGDHKKLCRQSTYWMKVKHNSLKSQTISTK